MDISSAGICKEECIQIKKIQWILQDDGSREPISVTFREGLSEFDNTIKYSPSLCYMIKPFKLNYLLLHRLGFQYGNGAFTKTCILREDSKFVKLNEYCDYFKIDSDTINKEDVHRIKNISALHELQDQVRELFQFDLCVDLVKCNHILCLICELQFYLDVVEKEIEEKGFCNIKMLPFLLKTNPYMPMPIDDVNLIVDYLKVIKGYLLEVALDGNMYLTKQHSNKI